MQRSRFELELLGIDLTAIGAAATNLEPYLRADGTRI